MLKETSKLYLHCTNILHIQMSNPFKQYQVQFSEEDLFHIEGDFCRMYGTISPTPDIGMHVVRPQGIFKIEQASFAIHDGNYDVYLRPMNTQCEDSDAILVQDKERLFRCHKVNGNYGFKKVTLLTLLHGMQNLENRLVQLSKKLDSTISIE